MSGIKPYRPDGDRFGTYTISGMAEKLNELIREINSLAERIARYETGVHRQGDVLAGSPSRGQDDCNSESDNRAD